MRLGATNMERYNYMNNRIFNVITRKNQYVPMTWESFITWCRKDVKAEPFLQVSVYGHVAGSGDTIDVPDYDHIQSIDEVERWIAKAGERVKFWGVGNEPWIAWKRYDYPEPYEDAAHGDQVLNKDTSYDNYFSRFLSLTSIIKQANPKATVFGPTSANWWYYWSNDYSPLCPVTEANEDARVDDPGWQTMSHVENQWNRDIFPDRGNDPEITAGSYGIKTMILKRFKNMIDSYYPGIQILFSEYDYFYWSGHPKLPQIAAVGQMDFLGFFARMGVKLACNWYVGEPNQSGISGEKGGDSAGQAMFNEKGEPNPKY